MDLTTARRDDLSVDDRSLATSDMQAREDSHYSSQSFSRQQDMY